MTERVYRYLERPRTLKARIKRLLKLDKSYMIYGHWYLEQVTENGVLGLIDLTALFGGGMEPTSVEEYKRRLSIMRYTVERGQDGSKKA